MNAILRTLTAAGALWLVLNCAGCGYVASGTWEDDAENWSRVFGFEQPPGVVLVHSKYWRAPHWTYEAGWFLQIAPNADFERRLFELNELVELQGAEAAAALSNTVGTEPAWFTPLSDEQYSVWIYATEPKGNFMVAIERETRTLFLSDGQM